MPHGSATVAWASSAPLERRDRHAGYAVPWRTIAGLGPDGVVVTAEATPWWHHAGRHPFPRASLERLNLAEASLRTPTAEEPPGNYAVDELQNGYTLVRVYFGTSSPMPSEIARAQNALDSLQVPPVCGFPSGPGGFGAKASMTEGSPGQTVVLKGAMPFQHEDGSYSTDGRTAMVAWWNAPPAEWTHIGFGKTTQVMGSGPGPVVQLGTGGLRTCTFTIHVTVPDVPPGTYPIVILQEGPMPHPGGSTMEASLNFTVTAASWLN